MCHKRQVSARIFQSQFNSYFKERRIESKLCFSTVHHNSQQQREKDSYFNSTTLSSILNHCAFWSVKGLNYVLSKVRLKSNLQSDCNWRQGLQESS